MEHFDFWKGFVFPYINTFIFLGLAIYFFRKPAVAAARKKREEFLRTMNEAKKAYDEANDKLNQLKARHANLAAELADIKKTSEAAAASEAQRIVSEAERLAGHLKEEAKRIAAAEIAKARSALRHEIVETVSSNVKAKISKEVSGDMHHNIVRKNLGELRSIKVEG